MDITERLRHPDLHDRPYPLCAEAAGEIDRLRAELASRQIDVETFREGNQKLRAELAAKDARIAELKEELAGINELHGQMCEAWSEACTRAERAETEALKAKAHIAALCDVMVYSDSYGVQGSEFQCCHACSAGAPNVVFKHDEHCPVGKAEASAAEWWDDYKAAEEDRERAETERDALLYNAESQYCAGLGAGFELGRNDDRAELSRIITQRWKEIADAKARAALAPSPAVRVVTYEEGARMIQEPEPDDGAIVHEDGSVTRPSPADEELK